MCRPPVCHIITTYVPLDDQLYAKSPPPMRQVSDTSTRPELQSIFHHFTMANWRAPFLRAVMTTIGSSELAHPLTFVFGTCFLLFHEGYSACIFPSWIHVHHPISSTFSLVNLLLLYKICFPRDPCLCGVHLSPFVSPIGHLKKHARMRGVRLGTQLAPSVKSLELSTLHLCGVLHINIKQLHSPANVGLIQAWDYTF